MSFARPCDVWGESAFGVFYEFICLRKLCCGYRI